MNVTIFRNLGEVNSPHVISLNEALERIRSGRSKTKVEAIRRKLFAGEDYSQDKKDLPFVVFSAAKTQAVQSKKGHMTHREDASVVEHSGLFILDFDNCDVELKLQQLKNDAFVHACWVGPSGSGVKALIKCPPSIEHHALYYNAFLMRYPELDSTSKNLGRGTYESYDPNLWINEKSLIWDKRVSEEERLKVKQTEKDKRGTKIKATAVSMIRAAGKGEKHVALRDASVLLGGAIAIGKVTEEEARGLLESEIKEKDIEDLNGAKKTISDGLSYGQKRPLHEIKKIEKAQKYVKRQDGNYDFIADDQEMDEYLKAVINGTLEQGLPTGFNGLNPYWLFKKNHLVWIIGTDSVGKSNLVWYLACIAAMMYGWKVIVHSAENQDGQLRKKLLEFYFGKSVKLLDDEEITIGLDFIKKHFRILSSTQLHTLDEFLLKCEIVIDEGFDASLVVAEPYNSFDLPASVDTYRNDIHSLNSLRIFKETYCSVYVCDHIGTGAARAKDGEGYMLPPTKADVSGGSIKSNKVDDLIIIHRLGNHPLRKRDTQIHVVKVRDEESGGSKTEKDNPVVIEMNENYNGYNCNGQDPVKEYWQRKQL